LKVEEGQIVIKISDFGIAEQVKEDGLSTKTAGTPLFMPGEVSDTVPYDAFKRDIYALGVLFYYVMSYPNGKPTLKWSANLLNNIDDEDELLLTNLLKDLVDTMRSEDPKARPTIEQLKHHECFDEFELTDFEKETLL
jgi:serine/threonine protein kinase